MNRRTKRRLIVLVALGGALVVAGIGGTTVRKMRRAQIAENARIAGLAAYEEKDYATARGKLITHLRIAGEEAEALTALGDAQRHLEEPNARHLLNARTYLDRAAILDPQNTKALRILLDIHEQLGNWQELADVAGALLELEPDNQRAATLRIRAHLRQGNEAKAVQAARELVVARDGAIEAHLEMLGVLQDTRANARVQREYLENEVAPRHEGTTSMAVLRATVEYDNGQPQRATEILLQAGESEITDGNGARMLLESLELIAAATGNNDLYERSEVWLSQWLEDDALAPHLFEIAAGRAWRSGLPGMAVDYATRAMDTKPVSEAVFGWGLLGAMELGLEGEDSAVRLRESFDASVEEDYANRAERWRQIIDTAARFARDESAPNELLLPKGITEINLLGPDGVAAYYDALDDVGRFNTQDAIDRLAGLSQRPSWRRARFMLGGILLGEGRRREALAVLLSDENTRDLQGASELIADALAGQVESAGALATAEVALLDALLEQYPENPLVLAAVGRAALASGDTERARELSHRLNNTEAAQAAVSAVQLSGNMQAIDAELAEAIVDRVAETATTSRHIAVAAIGLANLGMPERARELIENRADDGLDGSAYEWDLARIQLANTIADAKSLETIERVSASHAGDSRTQFEILNAQAVWANLDATGQIIARLRTIQGESGIDWRIFEARRLLERDDSVESANAAAALLSAVFESDRGKRDTRAMLIAADAFARAGQVDSELRALAFAADGNQPVLALPRLIDRLQSLGRSELAETRLRQFIRLGAVSPEARVARLQLLQRQGMQQEAAIDIASLASAGFPQYILRAGVESRSPGSSVPLTEAEEKALAADLSPQAQIYAARLLARVGRYDEGLARLQGLPASSQAGSRAILVARYMHEEGRGEQALTYLTEHAQTAGDPDAWMEAARLLVGQLRLDEAVALLDRAAAALPGNAAISAFRASIDPDASVSPFDRMARFAASSADREDAGESMRELGAIAKRYAAGQIDAAQAARDLDALAARRATFYPLWPLLIAAYEHLGQPEQAARRARDAVSALPGDPRPARDATMLMLSHGLDREALGMAGAWRSLATDPQSRGEAEMALGIAEYRRGDNKRAIGLLMPHLDRMLGDLTTHELAVRSLLEALALDDQMQRVEDIVMPLARDSIGWASFAASLATISPATPANTDRAVRWLETIAPMLSSDANGTVYLASAWMTLYNRTQDTAYADRVIALAESAERASKNSWPLESILATALEAKGEFSPAVASYERAMSMAGQRPPALLNNAAWLLTSELGEHGRAIALANEAVSSSNVPSISRSDRAVFHHTLGAAQLASGDAEAALRTFDRGLALAQTPSLMLGRIESLLASGRRSEATEAYRRLQPNDSWTSTQQARYEALKMVLGAG